MKSLNNMINIITFEQAKKNINYDILLENISGEKNTLLSYSIKKKIILLGSMIIPTIFLIAMSTYNFKDVSKQGYPIFMAIIGIFIGIVILSCYLYFKISKKNRCIGLNRFNYKMILFSLSEVSVFGYSGIIVFAQFQQLNTYIRLLLIVLYYILLYKLVVIIIVTDTKKVLNDTYGFVLPVKKWQQGLSRFPARLIIFTIVGMQVYRITKSFFILSDINNITNFLYGVVGGLGVILGGFCVGLLPTTFFDGNEFIQGALIKKYSEEFRRTFFLIKKNGIGTNNNSCKHLKYMKTNRRYS